MKISHVLAMIALVSVATAQTSTTRSATGGKAAPAGGYIRFGNAAGLPPSIGFAGDLSGTSVSQQVVGLLNHPLPSLTGPGYLHWNGTAWVLDTPSGGGGGGGAITVNGGATTYPLNFNDGFPPPPLYGLNVQWKFASGQLSAAIVGNGNATDCFLGNGQFAPCPSSTGGGGGGGSMTWPATAGIAVYSGSSSWGTSYSATTQIPASYIPLLNQNTSGNAGTATALAALPTPCLTGFAPTGILANGNSTGCAAIGGGTGGVGAGSTGQVAVYNSTTTVAGDANLTDISSVLTYQGAGGITAPAFAGSGSAPFAITTKDQTSTPSPPGTAGTTLNYSKAGAWCSLGSAVGAVEKCVGTGGGGGGGTTRTWSYAFQGVCQGAVASAPVNFPVTNSPTYVACTATNITPEWQIPAGNTNDTFWIRIKVPAGHTGAYTLTTTFRSAATTGSVTLQPTVACVAPGAGPDNPTFSPSGITITLTPATALVGGLPVNVTTPSPPFTPTCADGADLYVMYTFTSNTLASPMNFSYIGLAVTGNI